MNCPSSHSSGTCDVGKIKMRSLSQFKRGPVQNCGGMLSGPPQRRKTALRQRDRGLAEESLNWSGDGNGTAKSPRTPRGIRHLSLVICQLFRVARHNLSILLGVL